MMDLRATLGKALEKYWPTLYSLALIIYLSRRQRVIPPVLPQNISSVWIETTNACNLNCLTCQTKLSKRPIGYMELGLFEKIIKQCKDIGVKNVALHTVGEPFMHKELGEHLRIAHENKVGVSLSTNGQILTPELIESLIKYPPRQIRYSVDGATRLTYEKIRRGGSFERLIDNMETLHDAVSHNGVKLPMKVGAIILEDNIPELLLFFNRFGKYIHSIADIAFKMPNNLSADETKEYFGDFGTTIMHRVPCDLLWSSFSVLYDGRVSACCRDYNGELIVGNIGEQSLAEIWKGAKYNQLREKHLSGDASDVPLCHNCYSSASVAEAQKINISLHLIHRLNPDILKRIFSRILLPSPMRKIISEA